MALHGRVALGEIEVAYEDQGAGPAVILLHPFPLDGRAWADNVSALAAAGLRVIAIDYPGFGDSPAPRRLLSIENLAEVVGRVADKLKVDQIALVGLSMGGYIALAFAQLFPDRLWALVLADTRAAADGDRARKARADALATIASQGVDAYLDQSLPRLLAPDAPAPLLARVRAGAEQREDTLAAAIAALRDRPDRTAELPAIACPTLVLVGAQDSITPPDELRAMAAAIPGARFVEVPGVGHLSNLEAPTEFNRAVGDFLRGTARTITHRGSP